MSNMARSINVEPRVERFLKSNEDLRSNSKQLLMDFWQEEGLYLSDRQKRQFMNCTPAESILRARRALRPKYPGTDEVEEERFKRFEQEQQDHSHKAINVPRED